MNAPSIDRFRDQKPIWDNNRFNGRNTDNKVDTIMTKEFLTKLPCIKTSISVTLTDPKSKNRVAANDFDLMMDSNTSTALCSQLCGNGSICPELLPVMCENYKQSKCD